MKPIIEIQNLSKKFVLRNDYQPYLSLRDSITNFFSPQKKSKDFWALDDVSFDVMPGDTIGIIGRNGAGKSTLLKILSKITPPSSGKIIGRGRIASLLEVGTGFHPELSGRENVFMNGSILGMKRVEILRNFDAIVDFAGIDKFIDTPLKHYSSGMQLRLAFAVAAFLENEILIIDEVLAVGDAEFQKKCMGKMNEVSKGGRTILFVSHNLASVSLLCNKGVMLKSGKVDYIGTSKKTIDHYLNQSSVSFVYEKQKDKYINSPFVNKVKTINSKGKLVSEYSTSDKITISIDISVLGISSDFKIGVALLDQFKNKIFTNHYDIRYSGQATVIVDNEIPANTVCPGNYSFDVALFIPNISLFDYVHDICSINIIDSGSDMFQHDSYGTVFVKCNWIEK